jgi:carboxypeptidase Q
MTIRSTTAFLIACTALAVQAQSPVDLGTVSLIKQEALTRSQVMDHVGWLADVYGPRITGTPNFSQAADWATKRMTEWGLANVRQERFAFGQGWRVERFSAHLISPVPQPIIGFPRTYSPSTKGTVSGDVVRVDIQSEEDFARYKGQLKGKIVLPQPARAVRMLEGRVVLTMNEDDLAEAMTMPIPTAPAAPAVGAPAQRRPSNDQIAQFFVTEGVAAVIERGSDTDVAGGYSGLSMTTQRVDGGTIFPGSGGSRDPKAAAQVPSATIAVEHYNRMLRLLEKKQPVRVELNIQTTFYPEDQGAPNGINVVGEIPGSDLAHEVVIMGAHLDTTPGATGATDNATGSAAMMEALRVIKTLGLRPRRTIRVALWGGEEQGLLGSRAYVAEHFGTQAAPKPGHANVVAYYNLDNGTGKIRGVYLQGNEAVRPIFRQWLQSFRDLGAATLTISNTGGTDHLAFDGIGLPGFQFIQDEIEYDTRTHHSNQDVFDRIQADDMKQAATIMAAFVYQTAMRDQKLPRKPAPGSR